MSVSRFRHDAEGAPANEAPARPTPLGAPGPVASAPQDAQRFRALVQARSTPATDDRPAASPERRDATYNQAARSDEHERPERDGRWRWPADDEPTADDEAGVFIPPPPVPLADWVAPGKGEQAAALNGGAERNQKPLATQAAQQAQRSGAASAVSGASGVAGVRRSSGVMPARSFSALQAALATLPTGAGQSTRFSVAADGVGRIGFLVRRDQNQTHVVLELDRHAIEQAPGLRKSVQDWLEARGNAGVRVAVALRASAARKADVAAATRVHEEGSDDE